MCSPHAARARLTPRRPGPRLSLPKPPPHDGAGDPIAAHRTGRIQATRLVGELSNPEPVS